MVLLLTNCLQLVASTGYDMSTSYVVQRRQDGNVVKNVFIPHLILFHFEDDCLLG
jgi:hypothetical protein